MQTINVRELRNTIAHLCETLEREPELVLVSNGEPIARILPMTDPPKLQSMTWLRAQSLPMDLASKVLIHEDRDRRGA